MAAGTEVTQPVSVLDGVYKGLPLDTVCNIKEKGLGTDNSKVCSGRDVLQRNAAGRPPRPVRTGIRHSISTAHLAGPSDSDLVESSGRDPLAPTPRRYTEVEFKPVIRSGGWADIGSRPYMEDAHVRIDDLLDYLGPVLIDEDSGAYYGVFDGHGGKDAAQFVKEKLLKFVVEDAAFPTAIEIAVRHAFLQTDMAFAEACSIDEDLSSGTTAIMVLIFGRTLLVANAGDCRAVLCKRGKAVEMSRDHKPICVSERNRIEALGGYVDDGYLNGQIGVARALGDWHMKGLKGVNGPLSAEPDLQQVTLTEEDEFLIIGCDGLWDVFTSQNAVDFARRKLQQHNNPELCSHELVEEALLRNTSDNVTVVTVCFQSDPPPRLVSTFRVRKSFSAECLRNLQGFLDCSS